MLADIAAAVRGGVRDAETALERILPLVREQGAEFDLAAYRALVSRVGVDAVIDAVAGMLGGDVGQALHFARDLQRQGIDEREALGEMVEVLRSLMLLTIDGPDSVLVPYSGALRERMQSLAGEANQQQLDAMITAGLLGRERLRRLEDRGVVFEVALVRMAQAGTLPSVADLLAEVRAGGGVLETPLASGVSAPAAVAGDLKARVLEQAKDKPLLHTTLSLCDFADADADGTVVVTVGDGPKMHRDRMQSPDVQRDLHKWVGVALGGEVRVEVRSGDDDSPAVAADERAPASKPVKPSKPGAATKRVMDRFGGRVVAVNPDDRVADKRAAPDGPDAAAGRVPVRAGAASRGSWHGSYFIAVGDIRFD